MSGEERRQAIIEILNLRRQATMDSLAAEFGVTRRTLVNDIAALTCSYPIVTIRGRHGGGVKLEDGYRLSRFRLSMKQEAAIRRAVERADAEDRQTLQDMLTQYGARA